LACALPPGIGRAQACQVVPKRRSEGDVVGSVIKKRRKRMAKKKHRKLLRKTRVQRRNKK
jgi:hypothetical protein